jgi:excisionase family DNA binding protein
MKEDADPIPDPARELAAERVRLDRLLDRVEKCRQKIRQIENRAAVKAQLPAADHDIPWITVSEAAERWGVSSETIIRRAIEQGAGVKVGFRWRISRPSCVCN